MKYHPYESPKWRDPNPIFLGEITSHLWMLQVTGLKSAPRVLSFNAPSSASCTSAVATCTSTALSTSSNSTTSLGVIKLRASATRASNGGVSKVGVSSGILWWTRPLSHQSYGDFNSWLIDQPILKWEFPINQFWSENFHSPFFLYKIKWPQYQTPKWSYTFQ